MKFLVAFLLIAAVAMIAAEAYVQPMQGSFPNPKFPNFPRPVPFKPKYRFRRAADGDGQVSVSGQIGGGKPSWNVEAQQKIWENKHGSVHVSGGVNQQPGGRPQGQVGIGGSFTWG